MSTPVGAIGSGLGGGVELTLCNLVQALVNLGHSVSVLAPVGSTLPAGTDAVLMPVPGQLQPTAQTQERSSPILLPDDAVLSQLWQQAFQRQQDYDVILNFAYDWLPFYLTGFFDCPVAHLVSMGSLTDAMDRVVEQTLDRFPGTIGVHSHAQAKTFAFGDRCRCLGNGLDLSLYRFCPEAKSGLAWVGRIAPEKGIEDAIAAAQLAGMPLKIWGAMPDRDYWEGILQRYPMGGFSYEGFCSTTELQQGLGQCQGLLMTPKWVEAFGNVVIEALACGVPVVAYRRGGPGEIIQSGKTGWLVEPDQVAALAEAMTRLDQIDRRVCRQQAETNYSITAMGTRVEAWLQDILATRR